MNTSIELQPKRRGFPRWLKITLSVVVSIVLILSITGFYLANKSLPTIEGKLTLPGIQAEVSVVRDAKGIPHITAKNLHDLIWLKVM